MRQLGCRERGHNGRVLLTDARLIQPGEVVESAWVHVDGDRIAAVGTGDPPTGNERVSLGGRYLAPGFLDLHVHGGGGHSMQSPDPAEVLAAVSFHRASGTTRTLVSLVSAPLDEMLTSLGVVARLAAEGHVLGAHLEGPFLNPVRAGAHDPRHLLAPDAGVLERLIAAGDGTVRVVTLAPELPGGLDLVRRVVSAGAVAAIGHSDADEAAVTEAFERGATLVTHLFNGMRPWHHREPGLVGAALADASVTCELINDGVHLHDASARVAFAAASGRIALVTDATAAAGVRDGPQALGSAEVQVRDGAPRLADGVTLAGSTLTMDLAVRRAVVDLGIPIATATAAATAVPARVLGLDESHGSIHAGACADLVALDASFEVEAVMAGGRWITSGRLFHT